MAVISKLAAMHGNPNDIIMDSQEKFKQVIFDYYKNISGDQVPLTLVDKLSDKITDYYYDQYTRFRKKYPKSIKRYSTFQLKDIDHPQTKKIVVDFFKNKSQTEYRKFSKLLLNMTDKELDNFEQWWYDFERI